MNGFTNGSSATNGRSDGLAQNNGSTTDMLPQIHEALQIVHGPYSSNKSRQQASAFLEVVKTNDEAPSNGFTLASDKSQQPVVRHYALSLIEYAIRHKWGEYTESQAAALRQWVLQLSRNVSTDDPVYLRNKTAQLWVEIAKRSWGSEWTDMDELLVQLWGVQDSVVHKEFVLFVLETMSDEIFNGEDTVAILREGALSKACVEIFTPAITLAEAFPNRQKGTTVRFGEEGWLVRIGELLGQCLNNGLVHNTQYQTCVIRALAVYKSVMSWAIPKAIASASCVKYMCESLTTPVVAVQLASVEALHSLYGRPHFSDEEFVTLVSPMYRTDVVNILGQLLEWSAVDPRDIDDEKYLFAKRFSEMISNLGGFIEQKISAIPEDCDLPNLLTLFLAIAQRESFVISIPLLVTWTRLLRSNTIGNSPTMTPLVGPLLELCSSRLIRYESMPEDSDDPSLIFLLEDIDTIPERHAFLGNYRRYCVQIIEYIVRQNKSQAVYHILTKVDQSMQHLYDGRPPFAMDTYSKTSMPILRVDAQFTVVEAALKGYMKWRASHGSKPQDDEQQRLSMETDIEAWCDRLLEMNFEDPIIRKRVLQLAVAFSTTALDKHNSFMLKVLEHILMSRPAERPEFPAYNDAVKELHSEGLYELQRLATKMPNQLLDVYDQLEAKVNEIISTSSLEPKKKASYQTFLFTIIHRTTRIEPEVRLQRLRAFAAPVQQLWQNPEVESAISNFPGFCNLLGMDRVMEFLVSRRVHEMEHWNHLPLDVEGQGLQKELEERLKALPLRTTKSFLACSTEKMEKDSVPHQVSCNLWRDSLPVILPSLLQYLSHAHAFHNPGNWTGLPPEMRGLVSRILTDRFWQAGISEGSKDDFYARVTGTKSTMEGFGSSIRGSVRTVREACYSILFCMSRLDVDFYGFGELPGPLAHALFADAHCLSSHQLIALLNVVRLMVDDCPVECRNHFIPPILATCFSTMDSKCSSEWEKLAQTQVASTEGDDLAGEMKEESILRQLTHTAVMMIGGFLDPACLNPGATSPTVPSAKDASTYKSPPTPPPNNASQYPTMRKFCLTSPTILEPLLMFLTHAIRMRDCRCCGVVLRIFRSLIPDFASPRPSSASNNTSDTNMNTITDQDPQFTSSIREYISSSVLQACISSLNDPYFIDLHRNLAQLIATILTQYSSLSPTPRSILLSLPGMGEGAVDKCIEYVQRPAMPQRQQRALVLDLLRDIKGVSINEQGRITKSVGTVRKERERSKMQEAFMKPPGEEGGDKEQESRSGGIVDLEGVAGMFDEGN